MSYTVEFEILLDEMRELRATLAELNAKTDRVIREVSGLTLRVDNIKLEKLEVSGLEFKIKLGGNDDDCNINK